MIKRPILLVEDNPDDVELTRRAFKKANILNELVIAIDGEQALEYFFGPDGKKDPDSVVLPAIVLLDLKIPKVPGLEVLDRIRSAELTKSIPVVILTSSREDSDISAGYDLGVNSYIRKPVDFEQFVKAVQQIGVYWLMLNELPVEI